MPAYTWINRVPNIQKLWMCHCTNCWGVIQTGTYQRTVKQWSVLQKEPCLSTGSQPNIFPDRGGFIRQKTQEKKDREIFFLLDTLKTTFGMENLIQRWRQSGHFFRFLKKERGGLPLSSVACVMTGALTKKSNQGSGKYNGFSWKTMLQALWRPDRNKSILNGRFLAFET